MSDCVFCKIVQGEIPSYKIYEDDKLLAFLDIHPVNPGHVLVIPKQHYENLLATPDELATELMLVAKRIAQALQQALGVKGVNFAINNGAAAGQVIFHTHLHIIPRYENDGLKLWPNKEYKSKDEANKLVEKIKAYI